MKKTKLIEVEDNFLIKMELNNIAGSHKYRAAEYIIEKGIKDGLIDNKTTIIEKTGGNFGFGLLAVCLKKNIPVELAIGLSFSQEKKDKLKKLGAILIGQDMLEAGASPKEVIEWHIGNQEKLGKQYFYTDQFNNKGSYFAHVQTGNEIALQLRKEHASTFEIILVGCAGTGASLSGITDALINNGYKVYVVLVEPENCDTKNNIFKNHSFEGMSVGVVPPFLRWDIVHEVHQVSDMLVDQIKREIFKHYGFLVGNTSAACYEVARKFNSECNNSCKVLTFFYDSGIWYK